MRAGRTLSDADREALEQADQERWTRDQESTGDTPANASPLLDADDAFFSDPFGNVNEGVTAIQYRHAHVCDQPLANSHHCCSADRLDCATFCQDDYPGLPLTPRTKKQVNAGLEELSPRSRARVRRQRLSVPWLHEAQR